MSGGSPNACVRLLRDIFDIPIAVLSERGFIFTAQADYQDDGSMRRVTDASLDSPGLSSLEGSITAFQKSNPGFLNVTEILVEPSATYDRASRK